MQFCIIVNTDENGLATVTLNANAKGVYDIKITFAGDNEHYAVTQDAKIKIVYDAPKSNEKSITSDKTKQSAVSLKSKMTKSLPNACIFVNCSFVLSVSAISFCNKIFIDTTTKDYYCFYFQE